MSLKVGILKSDCLSVWLSSFLYPGCNSAIGVQTFNSFHVTRIQTVVHVSALKLNHAWKDATLCGQISCYVHNYSQWR